MFYSGHREAAPSQRHKVRRHPTGRGGFIHRRATPRPRTRWDPRACSTRRASRGTTLAPPTRQVFPNEVTWVLVWPRVLEDVKSFPRLWDGNLKGPGFVEAVRAQAV